MFLCAITMHVFKSYSQTPFNQPNEWISVFTDNFDNPVTSKWNILNEFDHYGEPQVYTNRNANVFTRNIAGNNFLVIKTIKENYTCGSVSSGGCNKLNYNYTSGWIETKQAYNFQYGYMEAKIKIPTGKGLWPAFWTFLGPGISNSHNAAEIDIFEMDGKNPYKQGTNLHLMYDAANFTAPVYPQDIAIPNYSLAFHIYGLKWTPTAIIWYFDNKEIRRVTNPGIVDPVKIILNVAIFPWDLPNNATPFPAEFLVDYVKVYKYKNPEFFIKWEDSLSEKLGNGNLKNGDIMVKGDFMYGDKKDELLVSFKDKKLVQMYLFENNNWNSKWTNNGSGTIKGWNLNLNDQFIIGDFDNNGKDNLLAISTNTKWSKLFDFNGTDWQETWHNNGSGSIKGWNLNPGDQFIVGDFDKDGKDDLLCISIGTKWSKLFNYNGTDWIEKWHNNGSGTIKGWNLNVSDQFIVGDFDKDGKDDLLCISISSKWSKLLNYNGTDWVEKWHNNGSGSIKWWNLNPGDRFVAGDFDKDGKDDLLAISLSTKWSKLLNYNGTDWPEKWNSDGLANLGGYLLKTPLINLICGRFFENSKSDIYIVEYYLSLPITNSRNKITSRLIRYKIL